MLFQIWNQRHTSLLQKYRAGRSEAKCLIIKENFLNIQEGGDYAENKDYPISGN